MLPAGTPPNPTPPPAETATWALNASTTASYDVYANWAAHSNRASDAKYTINHTSGSDTVTVNQKLNGGQWNLLGTYTLDNNSTVNLSSLANGYVIADGITILPAGTPPTVTPQGETATWVLNQSGDTEVYVKWTAHANRATDAKYTINHINGSTTVTVNQQQSGGQWILLGSYTLNTSSTLELSSEANGYVIADGIRLVTTTAGTSSGVYYVHNDHLGTPQTLTDNNQDIVWAAEYDPFGKATVTTETVTNNVRFPGQYFDVETGLHYNYFRYYDPTIGRYIKSDPIGLRGGVSTYGYAGANSLRYIDLFGLEITGQWDGFSASITDWSYVGFSADLERFPGGNPVDRLGYFNFLVSGTLGARVRCKDTDDCGNEVDEWTLDGSVEVNDLKFRTPYEEPTIPFPGLGYIMMADKAWRVGQYAYEWRGMIEIAGKALLNTPTLICKGNSFLK